MNGKAEFGLTSYSPVSLMEEIAETRLRDTENNMTRQLVAFYSQDENFIPTAYQRRAMLEFLHECALREETGLQEASISDAKLSKRLLLAEIYKLYPDEVQELHPKSLKKAAKIGANILLSVNMQLHADDEAA